MHSREKRSHQEQGLAFTPVALAAVDLQRGPALDVEVSLEVVRAGVAVRVPVVLLSRKVIGGVTLAFFTERAQTGAENVKGGSSSTTNVAAVVVVVVVIFALYFAVAPRSLYMVRSRSKMKSQYQYIILVAYNDVIRVTAIL